MTPQGATVYRGIPSLQRAPLYAQPGAHYPRHRHRQRGFSYFYGGWWYAYPWWEDYYYYGGSCEYAYRLCVAQWGYGSYDYYACMRYYGCY